MYKTAQGDTWDEIAWRELGSCRYVAKLIEANQDYVDVFIFDDGVKLELPIIEEVKALPKRLPPWR